MIPLLEAIKNNQDRVAVYQNQNKYTYAQLNKYSSAISAGLKKEKSINVALLAENSCNYIIALIGIWKSNNTAVPISPQHPIEELHYFITNSQAQILFYDDSNKIKAKELKSINTQLELISIEKATVDFKEAKSENSPQLNDNALIIYTSGTTNKPKGVVHTHASLDFQFKTLSKAWYWTENDFIPLFLPLHHIHGIVNVLCCCLYNGASLQTFKKFKDSEIYNQIINQKYSLFMAVPTIYNKLISFHKSQSKAKQIAFHKACKNMRLMISGSAALPVSTLKIWETISGHFLLERYGMSEIGMAISNPYLGQRKAGMIGFPFEGIEIKLVSENGQMITKQKEIGEIYVKGPNLFKTYWNNDKAFHNSFDQSWFKTGDVAYIEDNYYKIVGRKSIDIIKTGGFKVSALEIEEKIRTYEGIQDCAVIGIKDEEWGEIIAVAIELTNPIDLNQLKHYLKLKLAHYKIPKIYNTLSKLPRNAMGKVNKKEIIQLINNSSNQ